jgi:hypothetical protein
VVRACRVWEKRSAILDHLEQGEIDIGNLLAEDKVAAFSIAFENSFK